VALDPAVAVLAQPLPLGIDQPVYTGPANVYDVPPFVSRFLQVAEWKVGMLGQEFVDLNEKYERDRQVEAERLRECDERIRLAETDLEAALSAPLPDPVDVAGVRQAAAAAVDVRPPAGGEDLEAVSVEDLKVVFEKRAGDRAVKAEEARVNGAVAVHGQTISDAEAELKHWRDNRHAAAQEYVQTWAAQSEWYCYMRARYESLAGWIRMMIDLYWASNRRVRRSWWRRVAQALFGRRGRRQFVSDPITASPPIESPGWVTQYAHLAGEPTSDPMARIGLGTSTTDSALEGVLGR
jgi:hypothetical protein